MSPVIVKNISIGNGIPKICAPIIESTDEKILEEARRMKKLPVDIVEWRSDWYEKVNDFSCVEAVLKSLREILGETPLLMTFRTAEEGGACSISPEDYKTLNISAARTGYVDLIDVQLFIGDSIIGTIISEAHRTDTKVICSNHDFQKTPPKEVIVERLRMMQRLGADIPKIAVMPQSAGDVLTLLAATEEMHTKYADGPIITMSMAETGTISRLCGEVFGSAVTFGAAAKASAPGQVAINDLKQILELLHQNKGA